MPAALERRLKAEARAKHYGKKRTNAYVYGTMRKLGWRPKRERARMKKHRGKRK